ncbi:hypothetical protein QFZ87_000799 [Bacillus sp. SLBN-46]|uniref:PilZ domain-containing protein n=1 Tax=Bacillus sp. SLBN-46 TaxID=3042283 RepID=UPI00285ED310|nr:PilZ domain-containing protein [Bacillus sp. SLBN-46]MDR6121202.1 hypothetical protein [Bacillus sp. SLBN-46]
MENERREFGRVDFDTSVKLLILEPFYKIVSMDDASKNGLRIVTELNLELHEVFTFKNIEVENSISFQAKVVRKRPVESGLFSYGLVIES